MRVRTDSKRALLIAVLFWRYHFLQVLIHVVDRQTWKHVKTRYVTDPFFFMHVANAYEEGDHIIMDIPTYKDATILHNMFISTLRVSRVS